MWFLDTIWAVEKILTFHPWDSLNYFLRLKRHVIGGQNIYLYELILQPHSKTISITEFYIYIYNIFRNLGYTKAVIFTTCLEISLTMFYFGSHEEISYQMLILRKAVQLEIKLIFKWFLV